MDKIQLLKDNGLLEKIRETLGLEPDNSIRDIEISNFDDDEIMRLYVSWRASEDDLEFFTD